MAYSIKNMDPRKLVDYEKNAKVHTDEQIDALAETIKRVGFRVPIIVDSNNVIVTGHGRKLAAIKAGLKTVPVHQLPEDFDPVQIRSMRLFDNKIAETGWNMDLVKQEIAELRFLDGFSDAFTGFIGLEAVDVQSLEPPPDFQPGTADDQGQLDKKKTVVCPRCQHEF